MAKGINIGIASDTRDFAKGIQSGVIQPLEKAKDVFDDVASASERAAGDVESSFKDAGSAVETMGKEGATAGERLEDSMREAQRKTEDLKGEYKQLGETIKRESRSAGKSIDTNINDGTKRAKEGLNEFKGEAASTAKESAASFDGSAESIVDAFQEVAANAFIGFGPAGLIAGLAAAAGIGLISQAIEAGGEDADRLKQKLAELTDELIEAGDQGGPSIDYMVSKLREMAAETEDGADSLKTLKKAAKDAGLEFDKIAEAYVGNSDALNKVIKANEDHAESLRKEADEMEVGADNYLTKTANLNEQADSIDGLNTRLRTNLDVVKKAEQAERDYAESGGPEMAAKAERIKNVNDAYDEAAGAADDFINKETGLFDTKAYIKSMKAREKALAEYQETLATVDLSPEAKAFIDSQGTEAAASFLQGYKKATPAQRKELNRIWSEAGRENSGTYKNTLKAGLSGTVRGPRVTLDTPNASAILSGLQAQMDRTHLVVRAGVYTRNGNRVV